MGAMVQEMALHDDYGARAEKVPTATAASQFGLLLISTTDFWFFHEHPGYWEETIDGTTSYEKLLAVIKNEG